jgi:hypothetical protein
MLESSPTTQDWQALADAANSQGTPIGGGSYTASSMAATFPTLTDAQKHALKLIAAALIALG